MSADMLCFDCGIPSHPLYYFHKIRLSIFSITAVCVGLPCLIWAFYFVHSQRKTRGRISAFIILLLLSDLLQLLLYPVFIVPALLSLNFFPGFNLIFIVVVIFCLKICSLHLQQLVALEGVLTLKYPQISAHIFSPPCYVIISIIILLFSLMFVLLLVFGGRNHGVIGVSLGLGSVLAPVCLLVVTGIITYKAPPTPASTPVTHNRPGSSLILVNIFTVCVLYLPCVLVHCVQICADLVFDLPVSLKVMSYCLLSLTVISEPLLCVLVCRENLSTQTKQTHTEFNSQQTAV